MSEWLVLVEIIAWSEKHHKVHPQAVEFAKMVKKDKAGVINMLYEQLKKAKQNQRQ